MTQKQIKTSAQRTRKRTQNQRWTPGTERSRNTSQETKTIQTMWKRLFWPQSQTSQFVNQRSVKISAMWPERLMSRIRKRETKVERSCANMDGMWMNARATSWVTHGEETIFLQRQHDLEPCNLCTDRWHTHLCQYVRATCTWNAHMCSHHPSVTVNRYRL